MIQDAIQWIHEGLDEIFITHTLLMKTHMRLFLPEYTFNDPREVSGGK